MSLIKKLHHGLVFRRRVRVLGRIFAELLPGEARILDVGCGDGSVANEVKRSRPDLEILGLEVAPRPETAIPVESFDGKVIPADTGDVDAVLLVDVLHHALDPEALLREAIRVARTAVVVKDHLREGILAGPTLRFMDWVGNAPHGVGLPDHYWSRKEWIEVFRRLGVRTTEWQERLHLYPWPASMLFGRSLHFVARLEP